MSEQSESLDRESIPLGLATFEQIADELKARAGEANTYLLAHSGKTWSVCMFGQNTAALGLLKVAQRSVLRSMEGGK